MKKIFILLFLLPLCAMAQIDIRQSEVRNVPVSKPVIYDSLTPFTINPINNFNGNSQEKLTAYRNQFKQYLGQDIYFIPYPSKKDSDINLSSTHNYFFKLYYPNKYKKFVIGKETEQIQEIIKRRPTVRFVEYDIIDSTNLYKAIYLGDTLWNRYTLNEYKGKYFSTPYSAYLGHYFKIVDLLFNDDDVSLILLDENNDTVAFEKNFDTDDSGFWKFPEFILLGYYTKMKEMYVGNDYIFCKRQNQNTTDINTGENITLNHESEWHCSSLEFIDLNDNKALQLYLIFNNKNGNTIKVKIENKETDYNNIFVSMFKEKQEYIKQKELEQREKEEKERLLAEEKARSEAERLEFEKRRNEERERFLAEEKARKEKERLEFEKMIINKYGEYYGGFIIKGQVILGMSTEMCRYAWGEPSRINTTIVEGLKCEQWVYSLYSYLYFDNGKLTAIQN